MNRSTYTYAVLEVSAEAYNEIARKLRDAGYHGSFDKDDGSEIIDMHGIALKAEGRTMGTPYDPPNTRHVCTIPVAFENGRMRACGFETSVLAEMLTHMQSHGLPVSFQSANDREPQPVTERQEERHNKEIIVEWPS